MQFLKMPLFELFLPILQSNSIQNWTATDFWEHLRLSKKERNRFNRQRMYRILRKLVEFGFLRKDINILNPRFSLFHETSKLNEFRSLDKEKYEKLELGFPNMKNKISHAKEKCLSHIIELRAYQSALKSVIASSN